MLSLAASEQLAEPLASLVERRIVIVSGKGGTGKSTVAAAIGAIGARSGKTVLLLWTDGRGDASSLFGVADPGYGERPLEDRLYGLTASFPELLSDFVRSNVPISLIASQILASSTFQYFTHAAPGLPDLLLLGKVHRVLERDRSRKDARKYDLIVVDAPATGHALSLLALPRTVLKTVPGGPLRKLATDLDGLLSGPDRSSLVLVAEPAELAARETEEMASGVREKAGISTALLVLNRLGRGGKSEVLPRLSLPSLRVAEMSGPPDPGFLDRFVSQLRRGLPSRPATAGRGTRVERLPQPDTFDLVEALAKERLVVLLGPGGVGKTTLAAACGLAAAARGRRVLVMTVDPARRLVQTLGLDGLADRPVVVPRKGLPSPGSLLAMQIDPAATFDRLLNRIASPEAARRIRANRLYAGLVDSLPGVLEYMAVEALAEHSRRSDIDLIVLDTPPAARGLDFLSAPRRMLELLENDALKWFLRGDSFLNRALSGTARGAAGLLKLADRVLGLGFLSDLVDFFRVFDGLYDGFAERSRATSTELAGARFLLVTSLDTTALATSTSLANALLEGGRPPALLLNRVPVPEPFRRLPAPLAGLPAVSFAESSSPDSALPDELAVRIAEGVATPAVPGSPPGRR